MDKYMRSHKLAWLRLNSDLLCLVLLAFGSTFFTFVDPYQDPIVESQGYITPLFLMVNVGVLLGAGLLTYSLIWSKIHAEVLGRGVILASLIASVYRNIIILGPGSVEAQSSIAVGFIWLVATVLRVTVLFNREGIVFQLPPRFPDKEG